MLFGSFLPVVLTALAGCLGASATPLTQRATGSFSLVKSEPLLTFQYSTSEPDAKNWIGLYPASGGPVDQQKGEPALSWAYTPNKSGTVRIAVSSLEAGNYKAYFLAKDGYKWIASPIEVVLPNGMGPNSFYVDSITLQNARQGESFSATVSGLFSGSGVKFAKSSGSGWVQVSSDGSISGKPGSSDGKATVTVEATSSSGSKSKLQVTIPVRPSGSTLVEELNVLSLNLWMGGTRVDDYHRKQLRILAQGNYDIVGLQESTGGHATRLAKALGWYVHQGGDAGIISRYPIEVIADAGVYDSVRVSLDGKKSQVVVWNAHLNYQPYGPYDFCFDKMTVDQVTKRENGSKRVPELEDVLDGMRSDISNANQVPVLLMGDFNAPSHLDYTQSTKSKHCGVAEMKWPTSVLPIKAGLIDSFRVANPDPAKVPGNTWSPVMLTNEGRPEPQDRIDFIYHKGTMKVVKSEVVLIGTHTAEPNHQFNDWPTDHSGVRTLFRVSA